MHGHVGSGTHNGRFLYTHTYVFIVRRVYTQANEYYLSHISSCPKLSDNTAEYINIPSLTLLGVFIRDVKK